MGIMDFFRDYQSVSAKINRNSYTYDSTTGRDTVTTTTIGTKNVIFYTGSQAESVLAEKIRPDVSAVCIFDPGVNVKNDDEIIISSRNYDAIYVDDIAMQGEALVVALKEKS